MRVCQIVTYPGADHGYTWRGWPSYHEHAATDCFTRTVNLFQQHLRPHAT
ncbi:MAG: dienelactone hydrolase family protein [Ilumatobacteraceae bacterium]|nr:dienelactone hydrolase family protein [Ilumatobacteraceae bacterium]